MSDQENAEIEALLKFAGEFEAFQRFEGKRLPLERVKSPFHEPFQNSPNDPGAKSAGDPLTEGAVNLPNADDMLERIVNSASALYGKHRAGKGGGREVD